MENNNLEFNELDKNVAVILLKVNNKNFTAERPYEMDMCGLSMVSWVKRACKNAEIIEVEFNEEDDVMSAIKSTRLSSREYTFVLFSDTPLLKRKTFLEIIDYFSRQNLSVLKLTRGYIFKTSYLSEIDKLYAPKQQYFDEEDFMACLNLKQFILINEILQNRILDFHIKNGVTILNPSSTIIDVNVAIKSGTIIEGNNIIKGKCIIETNSHLKNGNYIENSVIKSGAIIQNSVIKNSFIEENCNIDPFCVIENNSLLEGGAQIGSFSFVSNSKVDKGTKLGAYSKVIN